MSEEETSQEEDIAAAWEAELADRSDDYGEGDNDRPAMISPDAGSERVLSQDEIDTLLGFSRIETSSNGKATSLSAILSSTTISYERLPMLEVVFERLVRMMTTSLRNFTSDNVEVSLDSIMSTRFGDYLNSIPLPAMMAVFEARQLEKSGLLTVNSNMIYSVVEVLLGGHEMTSSMRVEGRPYTSIELDLVTRMIELILEDFTIAFEPLTKVEFRLDRVETNSRFAAVSQAGDAAITVRIRIDMDDRGGGVDIVLPYATLEPIRELLLQNFMGEKFGNDDIWENHLASQLWCSETDIHVVLDEFEASLGRMMTMQVGDTLMMSVSPDAPALLKCGSTDLTRGRVGRVGKRIAVRLDAPVHGSARNKLMGKH